MTEQVIPNHYSAPLSELDLEAAVAVPPGGNWKHVPESVPLARLETIRRGFAAGTGSRSTYYGRLQANKPSYTINTYFSRPGNGCHLHYDYDGGQHRVLSQREAARLQSFPDTFVFHGSKFSINQQIGNAVPPLLAFQIAKCLGAPGGFVDLFSGAGGMALGFVWAGWNPIVANDVVPYFLQTHSANIDGETVLGDVREPAVQDHIEGVVQSWRTGHPRTPLVVLGGPPCQGFSTAGKRRSMEDERNHLFLDYRKLVDRIRPNSFVFENVGGLLNMEGGAVFRMVQSTLAEACGELDSWVLGAERFAIPQRRTRVILVGHRKSARVNPPPVRTSLEPTLGCMSAVTVEEAIGDLPALRHGEDGSRLQYATEPRSDYQRLMRGHLSPQEYLDRVNLRQP